MKRVERFVEEAASGDIANSILRRRAKHPIFTIKNIERFSTTEFRSCFTNFKESKWVFVNKN